MATLELCVSLPSSDIFLQVGQHERLCLHLLLQALHLQCERDGIGPGSRRGRGESAQIM